MSLNILLIILMLKKIYLPEIAVLFLILDLQTEQRLLIVNGGTGYEACLAAPLVNKITLLEENKYLSDIAKKGAFDNKCPNVSVTNKTLADFIKSTTLKFDAVLFAQPIDDMPRLEKILTTEAKIAGVKFNGVDISTAFYAQYQDKALISETDLFEVDLPEATEKKEEFVF